MYGQSHGNDLIDQLHRIWLCIRDLDKDLVNPLTTEIFLDCVNISDNRDSVECIALKAFIHKGNSCDHKILDRSAHHSINCDLSLIRCYDQHHGLLMFVVKILLEDIAFQQKSGDIGNDQINSCCDKKDDSGKLFRLLGNKKISHRQQHDHADMLYRFGKFSVISSLQDSLIGLAEEHYRNLA